MFDIDMMEILSDKLLGEIEQHIWERGYYYYLEGAVEDVSVTETMVTASVQGTTRYSVKMEFKSFRIRLHCSCPYERCCKHMAAVFFQVYESFGDAAEFLSVRVFDNTPNMPRPRGLPSESRLSGQQTAPTPTTPVNDDGLEAWTSSMEETYADVVRRLYQYGHLYNLQAEFILPFFNVGRSWSAVSHQLYRLYVFCFLIEKFSGELTRNDRTRRRDGQIFQYDVAVRLLQECFYELMRLCEEAANSGLARTWISEPLFWLIAVHLRTCLVTSEDSNATTVLSYQVLWMRVAHLGDRTQDEIALLTSHIRDVQEGSAARDSLQMALACLLVLTNQDALALALVDSCKEMAEESLSLTVMYIAAAEDWHRLATWLRLITERMEPLRSDNLRRFADYWLETRRHLPVDDECEAFLRKGLPITGRQYEQFILESNQMRKWVELQVLNRVNPTEYRADFLKRIETSDREALLPWYHQAIERAVRRKNRDSYKVAARMLKKLSTHYLKLKRTEEWKRFMDGFTARHARLRALHEEMRKKGLIS